MNIICRFLEECKKDNTKPECEGVCILWTEETGFAVCGELTNVAIAQKRVIEG